MNWFRKLFRRKKKRKTFMYIVAYYDFFTGRTQYVKQPSEIKIDKHYPALYSGAVSNVKMLLIFEEDYYPEDEE